MAEAPTSAASSGDRPAAAAVQRIEREVSATREEFVRGLRSAFPETIESTPGGFRVRNAQAAMEIDLVEGRPRTIALLTLPTLAVTLRFTAGSATDCAALLAHLDRYLHRGGG